jgi:type I restriction enzyme S subunit
MAGEWTRTRLGDHIALKGGLSYKGEFVDKGDALLIGMGCVSHTERFLRKGGRRYGGDFSDAHLVRPGDLVIATRQQSDNLPILGFPAMIPEELRGRDVIAATNLYKVTNHSEISNRFLYWLMRAPAYRERILGCAKGTTVRMLTKDAIEDFYFHCPPKAEREAIALTLDALDDKIELNWRMNATLEAMARALFQSWFIDFDPVIDNALAAGNPIPEELAEKAERRKAAGAKCVLPNIGKLFPDSFQSSELGPIPKGWCEGKIGSVIDLAYGKSLSAKVRIPGPYPVYGSGGINGWHNEALVKGPGIVVGRKGTVGSVYWENGNFFPIDTVFYVELKKSVPLYWVYENLRRMSIASLGADSAVPGVNRNAVLAQHWIIPADYALSFYAETVAGFVNKMQSLSDQNQTLATLRDTLLPKLLSGELRIPEAEKMVGDV